MANAERRKKAPAIEPERRRKTLVLGADEIQRLGAAAVREGCDESEIVGMLIRTHLSGYVIQVRGDRIVLDKDRQRGAAEVNPDASEAA